MGFSDIAAVAAIVVSVGGAFFNWGVMTQQLKSVKERQDKQDGRLDRIDNDLKDGASKFGGLTAKMDMMLEQQGRMLDRLDALHPPTHSKD